MKKLRTPILYVLCAIAIAVFFLYRLFPETEAIGAMSKRFTDAFPSYRINMETLCPIFPPGLRSTGVTVFRQEAALLDVTQMWFRPILSQLIRGQKKVKYHGNAYDGTFNGIIDFENSWDEPKNITLILSKIKVLNVVLQRIEGMPEVSGTIDGRITMIRAQKTGAIVSAKLEITDATLTLSSFSDVIEALEFTTVHTDISMERQVVTFKNAVFTGPQLEGSVSGTVRLSTPASKSRLNLNVTATLRPEYRERLAQLMPIVIFQSPNDEVSTYKFKLFGTPDQPSFSISR